MLKIAIDYHNTLADLASRVLKMYNGEYFTTNKKDFTKDEWTSWQVWDVIPMPKERFWDYINQINMGGINAHLEPVEPNLGEKICRLNNYYPTCEVLTAMPDDCGKDVSTFLAKNGLPNLKVNTLGRAKALGEDKFAYPFDIYVDDQPYMVGKTPSDKFLLLYDQPWNRGVTPNGKNEWRVHNWEEAISQIHTLQKVL